MFVRLFDFLHVRGKRLRSCRDSQLLNHTAPVLDVVFFFFQIGFLLSLCHRKWQTSNQVLRINNFTKCTAPSKYFLQ